jgi:rSAM/selenodomain-associated transferase 2
MISIVVPVLNEEECVSGFCRHLSLLDGEYELVVVDGGSSDGTGTAFERCRPWFPHRMVLLETLPGRGRQMNAGAQTATGEIFLFLHIDCRIPPDSLDAVEEAMAQQGVIGGGFRHAFMASDLLLSATSSVANRMAHRFGVFFGDFGIFIDRNVFFSIGGYDELPFLEDVEFTKKARRHGMLVQINRTIRVSPRRYVRKGRFRLSAIYVVALLLNLAGIRPWSLKRYIVDK